ncbi:putative oxidoreductase [Wallemia mellicola]|nr:putative oxidoreductase [Wallemia mellicola]
MEDLSDDLLSEYVHLKSEMDFDFIIVGGGTAGLVLANRLTEVPEIKVLVIEGGPDDRDYPQVLQLKSWMSLLGDPKFDLMYTTTEQPMGNSHILHSRAKVLGGCSSHNTLICFRPFPQDLDEWVKHGAVGWDSETIQPYGDRLLNHIQPAHEKDRNPIMGDWIESCQKTTQVPIIENFDGWSKTRYTEGTKVWTEGVGWLSIAYTPEDGHRSSASVAYMHPIIGKRPNLHLMLNTWVEKLIIEGDRICGVVATPENGQRVTLRAKHEVILSAGAIDSPRLLLLNGIGPAEQLKELNIPPVADLPVGENLLDHPESIIMWSLHGPLEDKTVMESDAALFIQRVKEEGETRPDLMFHVYSVPFADNTERLGYPRPENAICMTPNVCRPKSAGRLYLTSSDPKVKPALDFRYFTDPKREDERTIIDGIKIAREIAKQEPFSKWLKEEVAPGPAVQSDEDIGAYGRAVHHTVYHPAGTCKMGAANDPTAVLDPLLRVRGLKGIRVVDASVFPTMVTANPMISVEMVAERASDLIKADYYRRTTATAHL